MCTVSMVIDHYTKKPNDYWTNPWVEPLRPHNPMDYVPPKIDDSKVKDFMELLEKARKYDELTNQPDCEMDDKKEALKKLADYLGVEISFL